MKNTAKLKAVPQQKDLLLCHIYQQLHQFTKKIYTLPDASTVLKDKQRTAPLQLLDLTY